MSFTTKAGLKASVATWMARPTDTNITGNADDFVALAESLFNYGYDNPETPQFKVHPLRTTDQETLGTVTIASGLGPLPTDCAELKVVKISGDAGGTLSYLSPEEYFLKYPNGQSLTPRFYTTVGTNLYTGANVDIIYYALVPALAADIDSNWLLLKSPNIYLHGTQFYACLFIKALADQAPMQRTLMLGAMGGLKLKNSFNRAGIYVGRPNGPVA